MSDFKVYLQPDTAFWFEYSYPDIPWPVSNQDHFLRYDFTERTPEKEIFIAFQSVPDPNLAPVYKGVTRMELAGSWQIEQVTELQL